MQKLDSRHIGEGKSTSLDVDRYRLPDGREKDYDVVGRPDAVGILPFRSNPETAAIEVLLVRQPRPVVGELALVEVVAGKIDGDDDSPTTAMRELAEEVGLVAAVWKQIGRLLLPSPGYTDEQIDLFVAWDLSAVERREEDAHIEGYWVPLSDAVAQVISGEIRDMKTALALLWADKLHHGWSIV